jgi:hypothetical protein
MSSGVGHMFLRKNAELTEMQVRSRLVVLLKLFGTTGITSNLSASMQTSNVS